MFPLLLLLHVVSICINFQSIHGFVMHLIGWRLFEATYNCCLPLHQCNSMQLPFQVKKKCFKLICSSLYLFLLRLYCTFIFLAQLFFARIFFISGFLFISLSPSCYVIWLNLVSRITLHSEGLRKWKRFILLLLLWLCYPKLQIHRCFVKYLQ